MAAFIDNCGFIPTAGGTTDWTYSSTAGGYQSPTQASAVNGTAYVVRSQSADLTQWEYSQGNYSSSGAGSFARTTVLYNSSGTGTLQGGGGTKINFTLTPQIVAVVALSRDLPPLPVSVANGGTGDTGSAWTTYTPTITASAGTFTTVSATGRYKQIGKTTFIEILITVTTVGTAATSIMATLPGGITAGSTSYALSGTEASISGKLIKGFISSGATQVSSISYYDNTFPGASGAILCLCGVFEAA